MKLFKSLSCMGLGVFLSTAAAAEVISKRLADVIPSNGRGVINLFDVSGSAPDLTAPDIEAFRQDNNGVLAFAVDVNEAASGTEKSSSQGVTIASLRLEAVINGQTYTFTDFWTQTQSVVATKGSTNRNAYYTLIGDTGSSRITTNSSSDIYGSDFDATIRVTVDQDLSAATALTLYVDFLDTNVQLGDPEAFYDFSNGYEDVAIISNEDAALLDGIQAGQQEAPLVISPSTSDLAKASTVYYPTASTFYLSAFEDRYPSRGDYDFNDLVVAYRLSMGLNRFGNVVEISGEGYLVAKGALYDLTWGLSLNLGNVTGNVTSHLYPPLSNELLPEYDQSFPFSGALQVPLFPNTETLWEITEPSAFINTETSVGLQKGHKFTFTITLDTAMYQSDIEAAPFTPFLFVHPTGQTIYSGMDFLNGQGYPFGLILPENWVPPIESLDIGQAYPALTHYIKTGGKSSKNWYASNNGNVVPGLNPGHWKW